MIVRTWHAWASAANTERYERLVIDDVFPGMDSLAGFRGAELLRRGVAGGETEFLVVTRWESMDAIRGFAGEEFDRATIPQAAADLLERFDPRALHYTDVA
jgi:heme-degrading monooxygenase HmoA